MANKVNQIITDKIIEQLKAGNLKWMKNWSQGFGINYVTKKKYKGMNALIVNMSLSINNFKNNEWVTFNQIQQNGGKLNKGSKATQIVFFTPFDFCSCGEKGCKKFKENEKDVKHKKRTAPILRYYNIFNIEQTNLEPKTKTEIKHTPIKEIDKKIQKYWNFETKLKKGEPSYNPKLDIINMPDINKFDTKESYYSALLHEIGHSTGHQDRLNRKGITEKNIFGSSAYAYEELVAELSSAFMCANFNIEKDIKNSAAYVQSWIKELENDTTFIFKASSEAQKVQDYLKEHMEMADTKEEIIQEESQTKAVEA